MRLADFGLLNAIVTERAPAGYPLWPTRLVHWCLPSCESHLDSVCRVSHDTRDSHSLVKHGFNIALGIGYVPNLAHVAK